MLEIFDIKKTEFLTNYNGSSDPFFHMEYSTSNNQLVLSSQFFGTAYPIYLIVDREKLYISDSLISLKEVTGKKFHLNTDMLPCFFYNGFLPGKHTLIQGVYKLPPQRRLIVESGECRMEPSEFTFSNSRNKGESLNVVYDNALRKALLHTLPNSGTFNIALSSGFDSNMLLYLVKCMHPIDKVNCFSVGATIGTDETAIAASIAQAYNNVSFFSTLVSPDTMKAFDDIVFRLQGCVYERGIFLQYELAKMLYDHNCKHIICGECADQVFHVDSYKPLNKEQFLYGYMETPFEMASYVVLKKSAVMLKSFGITGIYPYLDIDVVDVGAMTRKENGTDKAFHRL